ncbi:MAG: nucleoside recognition protein [Clostridiales bacterium]|jgi:spore maturation protein A|nr:nucleoside recognition protein [Clostridiales bacterium]
MLNYLWCAMILAGIFVAAFTGRMPDVTNAALDSSKEAVTVCLAMLGLVSMWTGLMKVAEKSGLITGMSRRLAPLLRFLFPGLPAKSKALHYIATNLIANALGLGWAATPAGLKAMEELQRLNPRKDTASAPMCMFMIINMSSLQIVTVSVLAYRAQYGSANPSEIIGPGLAATIITTIVGVVYARLREGRNTGGGRCGK